jgi:hypothetical protein
VYLLNLKYQVNFDDQLKLADQGNIGEALMIEAVLEDPEVQDLQDLQTVHA